MFDLMPMDRNFSMDNVFNQMARSFFGSDSDNLTAFKTDILDKGDKYLLQAELPGFNKEDIQLFLKGDMLTISAEHKEEREDKKEDYIRRERSFGSFSRNFDVSNIRTEEISASYENGVLELALPKKQQDPAQEKRVIEVR